MLYPLYDALLIPDNGEPQLRLNAVFWLRIKGDFKSGRKRVKRIGPSESA
jgi:hypothetical protein